MRFILLIGTLVLAVGVMLLARAAAAAKQRRELPEPPANYGSLSVEDRYALFATLYEALKAGASTADLERSIPGLRAKLTLARNVSERDWTDSNPTDEKEQQMILPESVLTRLEIRLKKISGVPHVSAGVMHTWGYIFSQLETRYGLKGKRWIESRLDEKLGYPAGAFSPFAVHGEFLSNVTEALFGRIEGSEVEGKIEERVEWKTPEGGTQSATVFTVLLPLRALATVSANTQDEKTLLVYGMDKNGRRKLTTAFPIDSAFAASVKAIKPSEGKEFKPRFNLFIDPRWSVLKYTTSGFLAGKALASRAALRGK